MFVYDALYASVYETSASTLYFSVYLLVLSLQSKTDRFYCTIYMTSNQLWISLRTESIKCSIIRLNGSSHTNKIHSTDIILSSNRGQNKNDSFE